MKKSTTREERRAALTHEKLLALVDYDPSTGIFTAKVARGAARAGKEVGSLGPDGYVSVTIDYVQHAAGRLAWFYVHAAWPQGQIDHIDTNPTNNRISNLRDVTDAVNKQNKRRAPKGKTYSGLLGAHFCRQGGLWKSSIRIGGKSKHLGVFGSEEEAHKAYIEAKRLHHSGCTL